VTEAPNRGPQLRRGRGYASCEATGALGKKNGNGIRKPARAKLSGDTLYGFN